MEKKIPKLIEKSKRNDKESLLELIEMFNPLISKYSRMLKYEDAKNDLIEHFIVTIKKMPTLDELKEIKYIRISMKNIYIQLSKKNQRHSNSIILIDPIEQEFEDSGIEILSMDMKDALNALSDREKTIILNRYIYGYRDEEIGQELKISRQAVHKARKKALLHLDNYLRKG